MSDWLEQYSAALRARDAREQAHKPYLDACTMPRLPCPPCHLPRSDCATDTKLAERTASLSAQPPPATPTAPSAAAAAAAAASSSSSSPPRPSSTPGRAAGGAEPSAELVARLRADLASTQKARAALQAQVEELAGSVAALQQQDRAARVQMSEVMKQKGELERRVRDREEELRGKAKLVVDAQDEMIALELQLNLSEARGEKLKRENGELVERWMKRMGEEAERMNVESRWQ